MSSLDLTEKDIALGEHILGLVRDCLSKPNGLPLQCSEYTDLAEVEPACLANILEFLHEHEQLIITRVESQRLALTERGAYLASTGTPFAAWAKEFHSKGTVSTPRLKELADIEDNNFDRLLKRAVTMKLVEKSKVGPKDSFKLTSPAAESYVKLASNHDDFLKYIGYIHSPSSILSSKLRFTIQQGWVKEVGLIDYLLNPGPEFQPMVNFCTSFYSTTPIITGKMNAALLDQNAVSEEDRNYYMKCQLLSQIASSKPITTKPGNGRLFPTESEIAAFPEHERYRIHKGLPLADLLALFMVSEAKGDVCAIHIAYPKLGHVKLYVAKNQATKADEIHLARLVGLCQGDFLSRWPDYPAFKQAGMELLISFCEKKIRKRLKDLSCEVLLALIAEFGLESHELKEFEKWDEFLTQGETEKVDIRQAVRDITGKPLKEGSGDIAVLSWAAKCQTKIATVIVEKLKFIASSLTGDGPDILSSVSLFSVISGIADKLHGSVLFEAMLEKSDMGGRATDKLRVNLGKVGAYSHGLELLYRTLSVPAKLGKAPLKMQYQLLDSPPSITVRFEQCGSWYDFLKEFSRSLGGGSQPLRLAKQELEAVWKGHGMLNEVQQVNLTLHCEILLAQFLENEGIRRGVIGVSKACCLSCAIVLNKMNILGGRWRASGTHGKIYPGLLPRNSVLEAHIKQKVDAMLRDELDKIRLAIESPVRAIRQEAEAIQEELEDLSMYK